MGERMPTIITSQRVPRQKLQLLLESIRKTKIDRPLLLLRSVIR